MCTMLRGRMQLFASAHGSAKPSLTAHHHWQAGLGRALDPASDAEDVASGADVDLPLWMIRNLAARQMVTLRHVPAAQPSAIPWLPFVLIMLTDAAGHRCLRLFRSDPGIDSA